MAKRREENDRKYDGKEGRTFCSSTYDDRCIGRTCGASVGAAGLYYGQRDRRGWESVGAGSTEESAQRITQVTQGFEIGGALVKVCILNRKP